MIRFLASVIILSMQSERPAQCLLGNGICPEECQLYENAREITNEMGDDFDPQDSRRRIIFADAFNQNITVVQVAAVIARCAEEPKRQK